jgi:hypothetical protein
MPTAIEERVAIVSLGYRAKSRRKWKNKLSEGKLTLSHTQSEI